ncbi:MAG: peptidoglycan D,D-transpeptidase FtsI family protein [Dehalococcoidia bacterium]
MIPNIKRVAAALIAGFLVVTAGLVYWQTVRAGSIANEGGNPRVAEAARSADRGRMLDRNGQVLVESRLRSDGTRTRVYALPSLAQTTGYVSTRFGLSGLEQSFNPYLTGEKAANPVQGALNDLLHQTVAGNDLVLTIDAHLQQAAARALGNRRGAVVALDPRTGAVLALVSAPSFDPAQIDKNGDALLADAGKPLLNRATQGLYPPGSTYKVVTASAALDSGVVKPSDRFRCVNGVVIQGFVIGCENAPPGQTEWDFATAFAFSINATFAQVAAEKLGADRFIAYSRRFGMDAPLPFDIDTATSKTTLSGGSMGQVLLASSGFGQGQLQVTPLEMALIAATVANTGKRPNPYLVQEVRTRTGEVIEQHQSPDQQRVTTPETAATMTRFMIAAVGEFGRVAGLQGMDVAGKTGTAETGTSAAAHSWFIGFTPTSNPAIVVAAIVENGGPGSQAAAPIAKQVFDAYASR